MVDGVDCSEVPMSQARRGTCSNDASPGRTDNDGDFVWFYLYARELIDDSIARDSSRSSSTYNYKFPTGFEFLSETYVALQVSRVSEPVLVVSVVADVVPVVVVYAPMTLDVDPSDVPAGDAALDDVRELLAQAGVGVDGVERMSDAMDKVASMVQSTSARKPSFGRFPLFRLLRSGSRC